MPLLDHALQYAERGFSVIPVKGNKKPFIKWEPYKTRKATPKEIREWWSRWPGAMIGIVTGEISGILVIDCDTLAGYEAVQELLPDALLCPIVQTPRGWHLWFIYPKDCKLTVGTGIMPGVDFRGEGGYIIAPPSINAEGKGYTWEKGLSLNEVDPPAPPASLFNILSFSYNKNSYIEGCRQSVDSGRNFFTKGSRDNDLFHVANCLIKGGCEAPFVEYTLDILAKNSIPPFPENEIKTKIESALKRVQTRERNLAAEIREWVLSTSGYILSTDVINCLRLSTREQRKNVSIILKRLCDEGIIERYGNKNGSFRRIETESNPIDWLNADENPVDIKWPFGLENLAALYSKNIAVIAGTQNAGKTAIALNIAYMNKSQFKVRYLSSEMAGPELKGRLKKFDVPIESWKEIEFLEQSSNFSDAINPDGLNIVDYYEISDQFWKIAEDLKRIYEKLKKGVAIVCLQKTEGKTAGRGGDFGLEKPRLYLNLDQMPPEGAVLTIRKGKNWAVPGKNPNWHKMAFKIVDGCKLMSQGEWYRE